MPQYPELLEFCNSFIPVPETSGSSVGPLYPEPESTNPAEHNLELQVPTTQLENMSIDPKCVELLADVLKIYSLNTIQE